MVSEHRAPFLVSVAALCGRRPRLARPARAGNGISVGGPTRLGQRAEPSGVSHDRVPNGCAVSDSGRQRRPLGALYSPNSTQRPLCPDLLGERGDCEDVVADAALAAAGSGLVRGGGFLLILF